MYLNLKSKKIFLAIAVLLFIAVFFLQTPLFAETIEDDLIPSEETISVTINDNSDSFDPVNEIVKKIKIILPKPKPVVKAPKVEFKLYDKAGKTQRLSDKDASLYQKIFESQEIGNFKKANERIEQLSDHLLMGYVLYQRYMGDHYVSSFEELEHWLRSYADHAGARDIYKLALRKRPNANSSSLSKYKKGLVSIGYHNDDIGRLSRPYLDSKKFSAQETEVIRAVRRVVARNPEQALQILEKKENRNILNSTAYDALRGRIAESYYFNGQAEKAYALATVSAKRSKEQVPTVAWIAGLTSWRYKKYLDAAAYFEITARSERSSAWMSSAGAYWAARSYLRGRKPNNVGKWLRKATENPRSFYGIIALKALGMEHTKFNWDVPRLNDTKVRAVIAISAGKRAIALMDAKKYDYAEMELKQVDPRTSKIVQETMMAVAHRIGAPNFEMRLGSGLRTSSGNLYDAALYPDAPWLAESEYIVDKSLVHAFIRQESKFDAAVVNRRSGAIGLMQLMPRTARGVARKMNLPNSRRDFNDPRTNMLIGQKYIEELLNLKSVEKNLFKLAVSYNAGPGKMLEWERKVDYDGDALLFIESIPASETRIFVERVLANYWIYRLKYGKEIKSLEQVASGEWPIYDGKK